MDLGGGVPGGEGPTVCVGGTKDVGGDGTGGGNNAWFQGSPLVGVGTVLLIIIFFHTMWGPMSATLIGKVEKADVHFILHAEELGEPLSGLG